MAFRRRRGFRRGRRLGARPSRFAPAYQGRGLYRTWELLKKDLCLLPQAVVFPNETAICAECGGDDWSTSFAVLIPHNLTRGVMTLKRLLIHWQSFFDSSESANQLGVNEFVDKVTIVRYVALAQFSQPAGSVVPLRGCDDNFWSSGELLYYDVVSPLAQGSTSFDVQDTGNLLTSVTGTPQFIDIRVQRRFDRQNYGLVMGVYGNTEVHANQSIWLHNVLVRGLLAAPDGL